MFRPTSPQLSLLESKFLVSSEKRLRLQNSWAEIFRCRVLPFIDEEPLRAAFDAQNGRPDSSIRLLLSLHILQSNNDLTDTEVLDHLEFNLQWQHALGVEPATAHVCQKTLHNFRVRLLENDRAQQLFVKWVDAVGQMDGINLHKQRMDSTHILSNIAVLTRLGLFVETVTHFLRQLRKQVPAAFAKLPVGYGRRYLDREGYFADTKKGASPRRLKAVAHDAFRLVNRFQGLEAVSTLDAYALLVRLVEEQCEVVEKDKPEKGETPTGGTSGRDPIQLDVFTNGQSSADEDDEIESSAGSGSSVDAAPSEPSAAEPVGESVPGVTPSTAPESAQKGVNPNASGVEAETTNGGSESGFRLKAAKDVGGATLQSPHDPDATYGHKGKGYETQLSETCSSDNPYQLITYVLLNGANESDQNQLLPALERMAASGLAPGILYADTGYGSGKNIVEAGKLGVDLQAPVQSPSQKHSTHAWLEQSVEGELEPVGATPCAVSEATEKPEDPAAGGTVPGETGLGDFRYRLDFQEIERCPAGHVPLC